MKKTNFDINSLMYLMSRLRDPDTGCPWDLKQNYRSITASTLEEAYEVVDAIENNHIDHLREELGDLLFQVIFYAQLGAEEGRFDFNDVVQNVTEKLIRRHPHVFPKGTLESKRLLPQRANTVSAGEISASEIDAGEIALGEIAAREEDVSDDQVKASWEDIKQREREQKGHVSVLDDVPKGLPAMTRAAKLQKRAARVGFDWQRPHHVLDKVKEEMQEFEEALEVGQLKEIEEELGDVMFCCVNLARKLKLDPEAVTRKANAKFERRFRFIEDQFREQGKALAADAMDDMQDAWDLAKSRGL